MRVFVLSAYVHVLGVGRSKTVGAEAQLWKLGENQKKSARHRTQDTGHCTVGYSIVLGANDVGIQTFVSTVQYT